MQMKLNLLHSHGSPTSYLHANEHCRCVPCRAAYAEYFRRYRIAHRERLSEDAKRRRRDDHAGFLQREQRQRERRREELREYSLRYYSEHRERISEQSRRRREPLRELLAERSRVWCQENPELRAEITRRWRNRHPEQGVKDTHARRARKLAAAGRHTVADIRAQYERQKGRCFWCGKKIGTTYHVDHVVPLALGGSNGPENLVVSCPSCNMKKNAQHPMDFAGRLL